MNLETFIETHFDINPKPRRGSWINVNCPFCVDSGRSPDRKYHLGIHTEKLYAHCFRCHYKRSLVSLVMQMESCSFNEAWDILGGRALSTSRLSLKEKRERKERIEIELPEEYHLLDKARSRHRAAIEYLKQRGISYKHARAFGFGYCVTGDYAQRIIIPVYLHGELQGFTARSILGRDEEKLRYKTPQNFTSTNYLFNFDTVENSEYVVVMEGPLDVMHLPFDAVGLFTNEMSDRQMLQIVRNWNQVIIMLDKAARDEAWNIKKRLEGFVNRCAIAVLSKSKDPGEASLREIVASLANSYEEIRL